MPAVNTSEYVLSLIHAPGIDDTGLYRIPQPFGKTCAKKSPYNPEAGVAASIRAIETAYIFS
jgi:hypothetical protein